MTTDSALKLNIPASQFILNLHDINSSYIDSVGGKNASLGEMLQNLTRVGIKVPTGFATTVLAYREFLAYNSLDEKIAQKLSSLNTDDVKALDQASQQIRRWINAGEFSPELKREITGAYAQFTNKTVAVRSSATAEDLPNASFAGQQESFLNVKGINQVLKSIRMVYASLFTSRAISYRHRYGFSFEQVGISAGVQPMVRSDKAASGVIFTLDTESGFDQVILITASYGLGEAIVQGGVNPDEFIVYKPSLAAGKNAILQRKLGSKLEKVIYAKSNEPRASVKLVAVDKDDQQRFCISDKDILTLAQQALLIEKHYGRAMDIEWAKDGVTGEIFILQARPETVKNGASKQNILERYSLTGSAKVLVKGQSIGQHIGSGQARVILDHKKMSSIKPGEVIVTDMTDPDWEPVMKHAAAIVTNRGGRTCHAAIVARELGIPAVVGCGDATEKIKNGKPVTVSCADGQVGYVYEGLVDFKVDKISVLDMPKLPLNICVNMGNPERAFNTRFLPNKGVGLARLEFIISHMIGIHPNACLDFKKLPKKLKEQIAKKTAAYANPVEFYIEKLREGIAMIAAAFNPEQVIFRLSDFKSNEYANLLGGSTYEPQEENPMIGFRGASRYVNEKFRECFAMECAAFKRVREDSGLMNAQIMIPFVRTVEELKQVIELMAQYGLKRGENNLKVYMMCEIPSNAVLAEEFLEHVDGYSIGSNDLTQLVLGLDRDSSIVANLFDERNAAVKKLLQYVISVCNKKGKYIGICGQAPSDYPEFAEWLMQVGIKNISLNPDSIISTWLDLAAKNSSGSASLTKVKAEPHMIQAGLQPE